MKLPYLLEKNLASHFYKKWQKQFVSQGQHISESAWARTQEKINRENSYWKSSRDKRRRLVYFRDRYALKKDGNRFHFVLEEPYLFLHYMLPKKEFHKLIKLVHQHLSESNFLFKRKYKEKYFYQFGDLSFIIDFSTHKKYDSVYGFSFPSHYSGVSFVLKKNGKKISESIQRKPWVILKKGIRKKDKAEKAKKITVQELLKYFPAHMEIGAGASVSSGIPALHYLHDVFSLKDKKAHFLFNPQEDRLLLQMIQMPEQYFANAAKIHIRSLLAQENDFYRLLAKLVQDGKIFEPVFTNNFDGLTSLVGVRERYVRKIAATAPAKNIHFSPKAKSLIVVGVHADRRRIQKKAREFGLQLIYVDPEGFWGEEGNFIPYPLESIQKEDLLISLKADDFAKKLDELLYKKGKL